MEEETEEETYELFSVSDLHDYSVETSKYIYEGKGKTATHIRTDKQVCCPPVFKRETTQVSASRLRLKDTSKYSPQGDEQKWRVK